MTAATVTAWLAEPVLNWRDDIMLDGPLAWAAWRQAVAAGLELPPMTPTHATDFDLPLQTWARPQVAPDHHPQLLDGDGRIWGWCTSVAIPSADIALSGVAIRRRPATDQMTRWSTDRRHHIGLGPMKARNITHPAGFAPALHWDIDTTDPDRVMELLALVTNIGRATRHGHGRVLRWEIGDGPEGGWSHRPMPNPSGAPAGVRAPHHNPTRQAPCSW